MRRAQLTAILLLGCQNGIGSIPGVDARTPGASDAGHNNTGSDAGTAVIRDAAPPDAPTPPRVVGDCSGLGAVGEWQDITIPELAGMDLAMLSLVLDPVHIGTAYAGTSGNGVWKSTDCGANWTKVSTGLNGDLLGTGGQWTLNIDRTNPDVLYAGNLYGANGSSQYFWKSTNGGVDWFSVFADGGNVLSVINFFQEAALEDANPAHIVASFHDTCRGEFPGCMAESNDGGETWRVFSNPTGSWVEDARPFVLGPTTYLYTAGWADGLFYTSDGGAHWENVSRGAGHQIERTEDGRMFLGNASGMFISRDGHQWTRIPEDPAAHSPQGDGVVSDGEHIFTGARHASGQPYWMTSLANPGEWTQYPSPDMGSGPIALRYDNAHHLMYSVNPDSGRAWRVVTRN
jgi:hypothetical protein